MRRLLIIGCGDVALRLVSLVRGRYRIFALTRGSNRLGMLRAHGIIPIRGDLDRPETLDVIAGLAHEVVHLAPPPPQGIRDTRTAHLVAALAKGGSLPQRVIYISTSGVYGDCAGVLVAETHPVRPQTDRARRRADAEQRLRAWGARTGVHVAVLRAPGIYAADRLPLTRLRNATPALRREDDTYINHVHADDLARMVVAAMHRSQPNRSYNATDDAPHRMGDYFDLVADGFGLPRPARISRDEAGRRLPESLLSFMSESRRLVNRRIKAELRLRLLYPTVAHGLRAALAWHGVSAGGGRASGDAGSP